MLCTGDSDQDVLPYPAQTARPKKVSNREQKFFVLTSAEAYDAKVKFSEDKQRRERERIEKRNKREGQAAIRRKEKQEKEAKLKKKKFQLNKKEAVGKDPKTTCLSGDISATSKVLSSRPSRPTSSATTSVQGVNPSITVDVGQYVIVEFEGQLYPGLVAQVKETTVNVSVFHKSGINKWKWPKERDSIDYKFEEVKQIISTPVPGKRETFSIPELDNLAY